MDLTTATPVEIDTALAALYEAEQRLIQARTLAVSYLFSTAGLRRSTDRPGYRPLPVGTLDDAIDVVQAQADAGDYRAPQAQRLLDGLDSAIAALEANRAEQEPLKAEYVARGRWTRAFLVLASNGHIHRDRSCGTCFPTTAYGWLPSLSGHDEAEIVDAAGSDACTVCYPSAPVESLSRPRTVLHHTEEAAAAARAEKEALRAAKAAAKAAKALLVPVRGPHGLLETLAAAKQTLTDALAWPTHPYYADGTLVAALSEAIAAKVGSTPEDEILAAKVRAAKRR